MAGANITRFMQDLAHTRNVELHDYQALYAWSIAEPESFWSELANFGGTLLQHQKGHLLHTDLKPGDRLFC